MLCVGWLSAGNWGLTPAADFEFAVHSQLGARGGGGGGRGGQSAPLTKNESEKCPFEKLKTKWRVKKTDKLKHSSLLVGTVITSKAILIASIDKGALKKVSRA